MVGSGGNQYDGGKGRGDGGSGGRRRLGGIVTEGMKRKTHGMEHHNRLQVANLTN